jgi:hypothetical protein
MERPNPVPPPVTIIVLPLNELGFNMPSIFL